MDSTSSCPGTFRRCRSFVALFVLCLFVALADKSVGQDNTPSLNDLQSAVSDSETPSQPARQTARKFPMPQNVQQIAAMRAYFDKEVWGPEVLSQKYERSITDWWDKLIHADDKLAAFADAPFRTLVVNTTTSLRQLGHDITESTFTVPSKTIDKELWRSLLLELANSGVEVAATEWRHEKFVPPADDKPAKSVIAYSISAERKPEKTRFLVRGQLEVTWSREPDSESKTHVVEQAKATNTRLLKRQGVPTFQPAMKFDFAAPRRSRAAALGPLIVHDLDGDRLPEVLVPAHNRVFKNAGRWRFAKKPLFAFPVNGITAAVVGDFTGDGVGDLLCGAINSRPLLFEGKPDGTFPDKPFIIQVGVPARRPFAMTAGDIDADGDLDVFIGQVKVGYESGDIPADYFDATDSFPSMLLLNDGKGGFAEATVAAGLEGKSKRRVRAATLVDLDDDSDLDLLLTSDFGGTDLLLNDGQGHFSDASDEKLSPRKHAHAMSHTFGDYNADGKLDFITVATSSTATRRLDGMKLGRPDFPDYNQMRAEMGYGNRIYLRKGSGAETTFALADHSEDVARTGWPFGSTTLDFDRDGDHDIFITNGRISGAKSRDYEPRYWCHDIYWREKDRPNAVIRKFTQKFAQFLGTQFSWQGHQENAMLMNDNGGDFSDIGFLLDAGSVRDSRAAVSGDFDLDGRPDIVFQHADQEKMTIQFLRNRSRDSNHWVGVHLVPTKNNSTHGAAVTVHTSGDRVLVQHYLSGHSAAAQHASTLHFGLDDATEVQRIEVRWANGSVSILESPQVDAYNEVNATN